MERTVLAYKICHDELPDVKDYLKSVGFTISWTHVYDEDVVNPCGAIGMKVGTGLPNPSAVHLSKMQDGDFLLYATFDSRLKEEIEKYMKLKSEKKRSISEK